MKNGTDWLEAILAKERQCHRKFFGQEFDLTNLRVILEEYGPRAISYWRTLGLEPHFLPPVAMVQDANFPGWKKKPENWYYEQVADRGIFRWKLDGQLVVDPEAFKLEGITVLVDTRLKPHYRKGKQIFRNDNLLGPILEKLRQEGRIDRYEHGPQSSRFGVSAAEWEGQIKFALAEDLGCEISQVRLERTIEANVIPQLYPHMPRQKDGKANTWVWYEEYFKNTFYRLRGGCSEARGLSFVYYHWAEGHWTDGAFRPLIVLGF